MPQGLGNSVFSYAQPGRQTRNKNRGLVIPVEPEVQDGDTIGGSITVNPPDQTVILFKIAVRA
jgi:hypothetical protein